MWKILAIMDLIIACVLIAGLFIDVPWRLTAALAGHLLVKSWLFWPEPLSIADGIIGVIAIVGIFATFDTITWASAALLAYKSIPAFF